VRIVLDTNVFISGVFFAGPPYEILEAWRDRRVTIVASAEILDEYRRVGEKLSEKFSGVDLEPFLALLAVEAEVILAPGLSERVCEDPDDDKFLACALAGRCGIVVSGDKQLRKTSGYRGIEVLSPRAFVNRHLV
jgi:putative PIN family toxin of toxin-antitoxin system